MREQQWMTLTEAIHKMCGMPAARMGLRDRGTLKPGMKADLVFFDPATVIDRATFEQPRALATGIQRVRVNGALVWKGTAVTEARPGRVSSRP